MYFRYSLQLGCIFCLFLFCLSCTEVPYYELTRACPVSVSRNKSIAVMTSGSVWDMTPETAYLKQQLTQAMCKELRKAGWKVTLIANEESADPSYEYCLFLWNSELGYRWLWVNHMKRTNCADLSQNYDIPNNSAEQGIFLDFRAEGYADAITFSQLYVKDLEAHITKRKQHSSFLRRVNRHSPK